MSRSNPGGRNPRCEYCERFDCDEHRCDHCHKSCEPCACGGCEFCCAYAVSYCPIRDAVISTYNRQNETNGKID